MPGPNTLSEGCGALSTKHRALKPAEPENTSPHQEIAGSLASQHTSKPHTLADNSGEHYNKVGGATQHPATMRCRHTTPAKCKEQEHAKSHRIARNPTVQMHPGHSRDKRSSWEQAVSMSSAQEAARSGSHPFRTRKTTPPITVQNLLPWGAGRSQLR
jgi:hypothetical protein